jgi:hypothetical protein
VTIPSLSYWRASLTGPSRSVMGRVDWCWQ